MLVLLGHRWEVASPGAWASLSRTWCRAAVSASLHAWPVLKSAGGEHKK